MRWGGPDLAVLGRKGGVCLDEGFGRVVSRVRVGVVLPRMRMFHAESQGREGALVATIRWDADIPNRNEFVAIRSTGITVFRRSIAFSSSKRDVHRSCGEFSRVLSMSPDVPMTFRL